MVAGFVGVVVVAAVFVADAAEASGAVAMTVVLERSYSNLHLQSSTVVDMIVVVRCTVATSVYAGSSWYPCPVALSAVVAAAVVVAVVESVSTELLSLDLNS